MLTPHAHIYDVYRLCVCVCVADVHDTIMYEHNVQQQYHVTCIVYSDSV